MFLQRVWKFIVKRIIRRRQVRFRNPIATTIEPTHTINPFALRNLTRHEIRNLRIILGNPSFPYTVPEEPEPIRFEIDPLPSTPHPVFTHSYYQQIKQQSNDIIVRREQSIIDEYDRISEQDNHERTRINNTASRSVYEDLNIVNGWCGHIPPSRFWWESTAHIVDGTRRTPFYRYTGSTSLPDSEYYYYKPTTYQPVVTQLTPHAQERQYGRVFFGTSTRYVFKDEYQPRYPRRIQQNIPGYKRQGSIKIYCSASRYHNPLRDVLYTTNEPGILKTLTPRGYIAERFLWNIELLRQGYRRGNPQYTTPNPTRTDIRSRRHLQFALHQNPVDPEGTIADILYRTLRHHSLFDIAELALTLVRDQPQDRQFEHDLHFQQYYQEQRETDAQISIAIQTRNRSREACRTIERFWNRTPFRVNRLRAVRVIRRAYTSYLLRSIGITRTVKRTKKRSFRWIDSNKEHYSNKRRNPHFVYDHDYENYSHQFLLTFQQDVIRNLSESEYIDPGPDPISSQTEAGPTTENTEE
jgi:hypothetical protein